MTLDMDKLSLTLPQEVKVGMTSHFRSHLEHEGEGIYITTPCIELVSLKKRESNNSCSSFFIPCEDGTRGELNKLEDFVQRYFHETPLASQDQKPVYKPIWQGPELIISTSRWCRFFKRMADGKTEAVTENELSEPGKYQFTIEAPYVYIGPHKAGQNYSINLRVVQVVFLPHVEAVNGKLASPTPQPSIFDHQNETVPPTPCVNSLFRPNFPRAI